MGAQPLRGAAFDASAIGLSGLCLIHCLALPLLAASLPLAGVWAEAEWVHKLFVIAALPLSGFVIFRAVSQGGPLAFVWPACAGLVLLATAAFFPAAEDWETPLTVAGGVLLAGAHVWRWTHHGAHVHSAEPGSDNCRKDDPAFH